MIIKRLLLGINLLIGIGGMAGGILALMPAARATAGIHEEMLVNAPFTTFLIPGVFLILVIGGGNVLTGWVNLTKSKAAPYYQCLMGIIQCCWIVIQVVMLMTINPLHIIFFILGLSQLFGGGVLARATHARLPFSAYQN